MTRLVRPPGDLVTGVVKSDPLPSSHLTFSFPSGPTGLLDNSGSVSPPSGINHHNISHNSDLHTPQVCPSSRYLPVSLPHKLYLQGPKTKGALKGWGNLSNATPTGPMSQQTSAQKPRSDSTSTFAAFQKAAKEKADRFVAGDDGENNIHHECVLQRTNYEGTAGV